MDRALALAAVRERIAEDHEVGRQPQLFQTVQHLTKLSPTGHDVDIRRDTTAGPFQRRPSDRMGFCDENSGISKSGPVVFLNIARLRHSVFLLSS